MTTATLTVGYFSPPLVLRVAERLGRFADADLEVVASPVSSSPGQFRSLEAGEFDVIFTSPDNVLAYRFLDNPLGHAVPVSILAGVDRGLGLSLWTSPATPDVEMVRGGVVAVDVPQSGFAFAAFELLARRGLHEGDYVIESLGSTPRRGEALANGACRATILNAGNELRAESTGCHRIADVVELGPYVGTVLAALDSEDRATNDVRRRFVEVIVATARDLVEGDVTAVAREEAHQFMHLNDVEVLAHLEVIRDPRQGLIPDGSVSLAALTTLVDLRQAYRPGSVPPSALVDLPKLAHAHRLTA